MKRLVIVGASGMVGGYALRYALDHPNVELVTSVGLKILGLSHPKLKEVLHADFRPAYIYPVEPRKEPNLSYRLLRMIYPVFRLLFPSLVIQSDDLAKAMVDIIFRDGGERQGLVFENRDILDMARQA